MMERVNETTGLNQENQLVSNGTRVDNLPSRIKLKLVVLQTTRNRARKPIEKLKPHEIIFRDKKYF